MTPILEAAIALSVLLLALLVWSLRKASDAQPPTVPLETNERSSVQYFSQIRQAMAENDRQFLVARGGEKLARKVERERRAVVREFLRSLANEFARLMQLASTIAALSPEVQTVAELERLRLNAVFRYRLLKVRARLVFGAGAAPALIEVSGVVSRLSMRMEMAMKELGERTAMPGEMASASGADDGDLG